MRHVRPGCAGPDRQYAGGFLDEAVGDEVRENLRRGPFASCAAQVSSIVRTRPSPPPTWIPSGGPGRPGPGFPGQHRRVPSCRLLPRAAGTGRCARARACRRTSTGPAIHFATELGGKPCGIEVRDWCSTALAAEHANHAVSRSLPIDVTRPTPVIRTIRRIPCFGATVLLTPVQARCSRVPEFAAGL